MPSEDSDVELGREAARLGVPASELTRKATERRVGQPNLAAAGAGHSGQSDISERIEEILRNEG